MPVQKNRSRSKKPTLIGECRKIERSLPLSALAMASLLLPHLTAAAEESNTTNANATIDDSLDEVTVLASRFGNRTVFDSAVPIDVFSHETLTQALNSGEVGQALQTLSPSVNMPRASASGTSDSVRAIQLRGLAPDEVLVLVNGKRRHTNALMDIEGLFPGTVSVDLNAIPENAIDHIEILRDGAGAMYGSDAIAGVVNIVLKSGSGGGSVDAGVGMNHTYFEPTNKTINDGQNRTISADDGLSIGNGGSIHFGATYQDRAATNRAGPSDAAFTSYNSTPADLALNNEVLFKSGDPEVQNVGLFYNGSLPLSGIELYSFSTFNIRSTQGDAFFRYPGDPTNVPSIYPNGFRPVSTGHSHDLDFVAGARGEIATWNWDASVREGYNTFSYGLVDSLNASLGADSPTSFHIADFTYDQQGLNLDLTKSVTVPGLAAPINVSTGAEFMQEHYHTSPGDPASYAAVVSTPNDPLPPGSQGDSGLRPQDTVHLGRHVSSVYLDLDHEIASRLLIDLSGRYSHYSDYGSSTTGKFAVRYKLTDEFLVRASLSNNFRAPALAQTGIRFATLNFNSDGSALQNNAFLPPSDPIAQQFGAVPLKPERSVDTTFGVAYRPFTHTSIALDVYQIRLRNRITPTGSLQSDLATAFLQKEGVTDIESVTFLTNALDTTNRGLDLVLNHEIGIWGGTLRPSIAFNRNYVHVDAIRDTSPALQAIDPTLNLTSPTVLVPLEFGSPGTKLILGTDWSSALWGAHVQATRYGSMYAYSFDSAAPLLDGFPVQKYNPAWSVDLEGHYNINKWLTATVGGTDVFNRYPDQTAPGGNFGGAFPYNYVNPLGINGAYYYVHLTAWLGR